MRRLQHTRGLACMLAAAGTMIASGAATADMATVPQNSDDVRALVSEMLADAEGRSSLLQSGATAGHDGGFFVSSADGAFKLNIKGFMQFRYELNFRDGNTIGDDFTPGFNAPRTVMFFKGQIFDDIGYQIRMNFMRITGGGVLDDAFMTYKIDDNWSVRAGQGLHAFDREWFHGDVKLQTIERSLVALMFGGQRTQGIMAKYQGDDFRTFLTFSDGLRGQNTDFGASNADFAFTARGEFKLAGDWKSVTGPLTSPMGSEDAFAIGGAVHYETGPDSGLAGSVEQDLFAWTADLNYKSDGWNVMAAVTGYHTSDEAGVAGADFDEFGFVLQSGVYLSEDTELYGRYTLISPDDARAANDDFNAIALGVNWYIHGHAARLTVQGELFLDPTTDTVAGNFGNTGGRNPASSLFGVLADDDDNQFALSAQFQLLF